MAEKDFGGECVVLALKCDATRDRMAEALVGCDFYLNDPVALEHIVACDGPEGPWRVETPKGPRALTRDRLAQG